jgi:hypothetical protein
MALKWGKGAGSGLHDAALAVLRTLARRCPDEMPLLLVWVDVSLRCV